jgi:NTE family protein
VEVKGVSDAAAAQIAARIEADLNYAQDPTVIESHLDWLIGLGRYASAMYRRADRDGASGLRVEVRDKSYAPPLVRFVIDVDNESKDVNVSVGSRITFMDVTSAASELRIDTSLGAKLRFRTELLQPLSGKGPLRRGAFVAPSVLYERTSESFYEDSGALRAIYNRQRVGAGFDLGWTIGRTTEIRIGPEVDYVRNTTRVGDELPESIGREAGARFRFEHDGQDRAYFPTRGTRLTSAVTWITTAPYAVQPFGRAEGALYVARSIRGGHVITFHASGGASLGVEPPLLYRFSLGGPFRLGAFPPNSLRGSSFFLGRAAFRVRLKQLPTILGDRLYLLSMVESGSAFDRAADARVKASFTTGLAADTFFGPLFLGVSVRGYFVVGTLLR